MPHPLKQSLGASEWHQCLMNSLRSLERLLDKAEQVDQIIDKKWLSIPPRQPMEKVKTKQSLHCKDLLLQLQEDLPLLARRKEGAHTLGNLSGLYIKFQDAHLILIGKYLVFQPRI